MKKYLSFFENLDIDSISLDSAAQTQEIRTIIKELKTVLLILANKAVSIDIPRELVDKTEKFIEKFTSKILLIKDRDDLTNIKENKENFNLAISEFIRDYKDLFKYSSQLNNYFISLSNNLNAFNDQKFDKIEDSIKELDSKIKIFDETYSTEALKKGDTLKQIEEYKNKIKLIYEETINFSKDTIIAKYAKEFEGYSKDKGRAAFGWLFVGVLFTLFFIIALGAGFFEYLMDNRNLALKAVFGIEQNYSIIDLTNSLSMYSKIGTYVLLVAIMVYVMLFIARQYIINKNLEAINKHKAIALNSYTAFKASLGDNNKQVEVILIEVAKAIYSYPNNGYFKNDSGENFTLGLNKLTKEIIKESAK